MLKFFGRHEAGSEEQRTETVKQLRSLLTSDPIGKRLDHDKLANDKFLERFLHHHKWNLQKALSVLKDYVTRNEGFGGSENFIQGDNQNFPSEFQNIFKCYYGGSDFANRPVIMIPVESEPDFTAYLDSLNGPNFDSLLNFMLRKHMTIEKLVLERNADHAVIVLDVKNVRLSQYLHRKTLNFLRCTSLKLEGHSPGVTGKVVIVNAPGVMKTVVNLLKKMVEFHTEIVIFGCKDADWREGLREHVPESGVTPEFGGTLIKPKEI